MEGESELRVPALDPEGLRFVDEADDPFPDHRPDFVYCPVAAWGPEGGGFEVQTGACNYASFSQRLPRTLVAGDRIAISLWHDRLDAVAPASAHVAVFLGDEVLWELEVDIPA